MKNQFLGQSSQDNISGQGQKQKQQEPSFPSPEMKAEKQPPIRKSGLLSTYNNQVGNNQAGNNQAGQSSMPGSVGKFDPQDHEIASPDNDPLRNRRLPRYSSVHYPDAPSWSPDQLSQRPTAQPAAIKPQQAPMSGNPAAEPMWSYVPEQAGSSQQPPSGQAYLPGGNFNGSSSPPPPYAYGNGNGGNNGSFPPGQKKPHRRLPIWSRVLIAILAFLTISGGGAFAYYQINYAHSINDITGQAAIRKDTTTNINADPLTQRTNIVLLGSDTDGKGNDPNAGQPLAQTVIIVTIDPKTNYVGMLSIPRDMQMTDPAYQYEYPGGKIDEVFQQAWQGNTEQEKARSAAGHIMDVIQANYGITINYYAWVGLQGFVKVIDDLGGIDIDATHPMTDDNYPYDTGTGANNKYGYQRLYIPPGPQHMDGQLALEYVRTRHSDLGGDFGRTARQQQVLSQIKVKMTQTDTISKAPELLQSLDGYLMTDLTLSQLASLAQVAKNVDINKVQRVSFGSSQYATQITNGRGNYSPVCDAVEKTIQQMFGVTPNCIPQGDPVGQTSTANQTVTTQFTPASTNIPAQKTTSQATQLSQPVSATALTDGVNNLFDLMLLTASGSFNAIQ